MFDFLKRKKTIPIFESVKTDIHCHLLPGVDDGAKDVSETIFCLQTLREAGFSKVCFTPHFQSKYPNDEEDIKQRFDRLKKEIEAQHAEGLPEIGAISGEYRFDHIYHRRPGIDKVTPLPGNTLLCEFSLHDNRYMPIDILREFHNLGYRLILAHPERYPYLGIHSNEIEEMQEMGMGFQVNILSLNGFYGQIALKKGFEYINSGIAKYLGTDMHNRRYAQELLATTNNKDVQRLIKKHQFLNNEF